MNSKVVAVLACIVTAACVGVAASAEAPKQRMKPRAPEDSMRALVNTLAARDVKAVKHAYITKDRFADVVPEKGPTYAKALARFEQSVKDFLGRSLPIEKMRFEKIDYKFCPHPMIAPKPRDGSRRMFVMYDNLRVVVGIEGRRYAFKIDALVADDDKWAVIGGIGALKEWWE